MIRKFAKKQILVVHGEATLANWLLDQGAHVRVLDHALIRSIQGHLRAVATDGDEYADGKNRLRWVEGDLAKAVATADVIVARADHEAVLLAYEHGVPVLTPQELRRMPEIPSRRRIIAESPKLTIIHDGVATDPARAIASIERFGGPNCILIAGGSGRGNYVQWAEAVSSRIRPTSLILVAGSATGKMRQALGGHARGIRTYDTLERCLKVARDRAKLFVHAVILFSPAAGSDDLKLS